MPFVLVVGHGAGVLGSDEVYIAIVGRGEVGEQLRAIPVRTILLMCGLPAPGYRVAERENAEGDGSVCLRVSIVRRIRKAIDEGQNYRELLAAEQYSFWICNKTYRMKAE